VDVDDACFLTLESGPWRVRIIFDHALGFNFIDSRIRGELPTLQLDRIASPYRCDRPDEYLAQHRHFAVRRSPMAAEYIRLSASRSCRHGSSVVVSYKEAIPWRRDAYVSVFPFFRSWCRQPTFFFPGSKHTALARAPAMGRCQLPSPCLVKQSAQY
jgi:hypothetical protein